MAIRIAHINGRDKHFPLLCTMYLLLSRKKGRAAMERMSSAVLQGPVPPSPDIRISSVRRRERKLCVYFLSGEFRLILRVGGLIMYNKNVRMLRICMYTYLQHTHHEIAFSLHAEAVPSAEGMEFFRKFGFLSSVDRTRNVKSCFNLRRRGRWIVS